MLAAPKLRCLLTQASKVARSTLNTSKTRMLMILTSWTRSARRSDSRARKMTVARTEHSRGLCLKSLSCSPTKTAHLMCQHFTTGYNPTLDKVAYSLKACLPEPCCLLGLLLAGICTRARTKSIIQSARLLVFHSCCQYNHPL